MRLAPEDCAHLLGLDESLLNQLLFDLVEGFAPEVAQREQLLLTLLEQLSHGLDLVRLEAVESPDRKVELLDRRGHQADLAAPLAAHLPLMLLDRVSGAD